MQALSASVGSALLFGIEAAAGVAGLGGIMFLNNPAVVVGFLWAAVVVGLVVGGWAGLFILRREREMTAEAPARAPLVPGSGAIGGSAA